MIKAFAEALKQHKAEMTQEENDFAWDYGFIVGNATIHFWREIVTKLTEHYKLARARSLARTQTSPSHPKSRSRANRASST
jgi:hypothetical protein